MATKATGTFLLIFIILEVGARWLAHTRIDEGSTIPIAGIFYLTNVTNQGSGLAFGWSSIAWLMLGLVVSTAICASFLAAWFLSPALKGNPFIKLGVGASAMTIAVALLNIGEVLLRKGVTDYLALIDVERGAAWIINAGDVVLYLSLGLVAVSYVGAFAMILGSSVRSAGTTG